MRVSSSVGTLQIALRDNKAGQESLTLLRPTVRDNRCVIAGRVACSLSARISSEIGKF